MKDQPDTALEPFEAGLAALEKSLEDKLEELLRICDEEAEAALAQLDDG